MTLSGQITSVCMTGEGGRLVEEQWAVPSCPGTEDTTGSDWSRWGCPPGSSRGDDSQRLEVRVS